MFYLHKTFPVPLPIQPVKNKNEIINNHFPFYFLSSKKPFSFAFHNELEVLFKSVAPLP